MAPGGAVGPRAGRSSDCARERARVCAVVRRRNDQRGWALAEQGAVEEGIAQYARVWRPGGPWGESWDCRIFLLSWPRRMGKEGRAEEGLRVLAEALAIVHKNAERHYEAELYRLKGELLLQAGQRSWAGQASAASRGRSLLSSGARRCPPSAGEVSGATGSDEFESSVAATRQTCRSPPDAGRIYGWFTEGFDTPDLQEAKALLEALAVN